MPQKDLRELSGRQAKQLGDVSVRYGIRCKGRAVDLAELLRDLFDFVARWGPKIESFERDDPVAAGRRIQNEQRQLELDVRRGELLNRDDVLQCYRVVATRIRRATDALQRKYGPEAASILEAALTDADRQLGRVADKWNRQVVK